MTIDSLAATTFFGHQTLKFTKIGIIIAVASIAIALVKLLNLTDGLNFGEYYRQYAELIQTVPLLEQESDLTEISRLLQ